MMLNSDAIIWDHTYQREIFKRIIQFVELFYLVYGIFVAYIWTSKELDTKASNTSVTSYFWDPVITTYSLGNMAVFGMIMITKYWSYKSLHRGIVQRPDNHLIVCFMIIPLFISSIIFNIIELVRDLATIPCHGYMTFLVPLSSLALITGAAILIFDVGYFKARLDNWIKDLMKSNLIFFTVIGITNCLLITVSMQHVKIFRQESLNSTYGNRFQSNESCIKDKPIAYSLNVTSNECDKYLRPTYILFCVCTLAYIIQPRAQSEDKDEREIESDSSLIIEDTDRLLALSEDNLQVQMENPVKEMNDDRNVSYRLPSASLVICITFLSLSLLGFIITYSLRQGHRPNWHNELGSLIYSSFISVVYLIGSGLSVVHIKEIKRWPISQNRRGNVIDKCLIWVGAGGQLSVALTFVSSAVVLLVETRSDIMLTMLLCILILSTLLMTVQTFLQTIQISLLLDRKWIRPNINSLVESLCPAVGLMGLNIGLLLLSVDQLKSPVLIEGTKILFIDLFSREMRCVGETLGILQRLHASLLFASMIVYTHN